MFKQKIYGSCPECDGPCDFLDSTVKMAVCLYCNNGFTVNSHDFKSIGNLALEGADHSPLYTFATGVLDERPFTVTGRFRFFSGGTYIDRWCLYFDETDEYQWLTESEDDFSLAEATAKGEEIPDFLQLSQGARFEIAGTIVSVSEIHEHRLVGAEGGLPEVLKPDAIVSTVIASFGNFTVSIRYAGEDKTVAIEHHVDEDSIELDLLKEELEDI